MAAVTRRRLRTEPGPVAEDGAAVAALGVGDLPQLAAHAAARTIRRARVTDDEGTDRRRRVRAMLSF